MLKKVWHFLWYDDSLASWIVNLILAFILVKYAIYPGIGLLLGTSYPIVAVVSSSMEHHPGTFNTWWENNRNWYEQHDITQQDFKTYRFKNGFNKGDIMLLKGKQPKAIKRGDVLVYQNPAYKNPIIHRVIDIQKTDEHSTYTTKGDNNPQEDAFHATDDHIKNTGVAILRFPLLGWIKIWFVTLLGGA